ncbi:ABC transporter permease [Paenibacillaceae bacterium]|nr:ABC transporter permease [Paenibacillaceae bacterium]
MSVRTDPQVSARKPGFRMKRNGKVTDVLLGAAFPVILVVIWQTAGFLGIIDSFFLPTPWEIANGFYSLIVSGELFQHLSVSLRRAAAGFLSGGVAAFLLGVWTGFSRKSEDFIDPTLQIIRIVPGLALAPLIILWFGFGETSKIVIIAIGSFFPIYINTFLGIRSVENKLYEVSRVLQFSRYRRLIKLVVPSSLPHLLLGVRLSLAIAWLSLIVAELVGASAGVGSLILSSAQHGRTDLVFVGVIIFAIVGKLVDSFIKLLEQRWLKWRDSYQG